jgi:hypothetical protein
MTTAEAEVMRRAAERQKYAPRKQNNKKRDLSTLYFVDKKDTVPACRGCADKVEVARQRLAELTSKSSICVDEMSEIYQLQQTVSQGVPLTENDVCGDCVCTGCGVVVSRAAALGTDYNDFDRVCPTSKARTRENYMRERMSQWNLAEPPIPLSDCEKLRAVYNGGYGRNEHGTVLEFDPALQKQTVRLIIIRAGLSTKKYTEKWLSIRKMLGAEVHPLPTAELVAFILERFVTIVQVWQRYGASLCPPGHARKSLFNYNYMIQRLLLLHSVEAYNTHVAWFPVQASQKVDAMDAMWRALCAVADWPCYQPIWSDKKVTGRRLETAIKSSRQTVKRRRRNEVKQTSQPTLRLPSARVYLSWPAKKQKSFAAALRQDEQRQLAASVAAYKAANSTQQ